MPVTCGSAFKNKGVQPLLDAVVDYMPSPLDIPPIKGVLPDSDQEDERPSSDDAPFAALAFKIMNDPFVGSLTFTRIYSGKLTKGQVLNSVKDKKEKIGRMLLMHSNNREDIDEAFAGDIVALAGMKDTTTGDTLCDASKPIILERMEFPEPVIELSVEPKTKADQEKMGIALNRLAQEDPSFRVSTDHESGQTIIKGMGELHLDIIVDRMRREFKVEANVGAPQVAYREYLAREVEVDYTHKKQSGGSGQFGRVKVTVTPGERGQGVIFEDQIKGGNIPREYIPAIEKGFREQAESGHLVGFPIIDFSIKLTDGAYHDVDSSAIAFEIAARGAMREVAQKSGIKLLEPIMKVEVVTPDDYLATSSATSTAAAARSRAPTRAAMPRRSRPSCRSPTCSATSTSCVRSPRGVRSTPCSSRTMTRFRPTSQPRSRRNLPKLPRSLGAAPDSAGAATLPRTHIFIQEGTPEKWPRKSSSGISRTATSAPSVTSTMARPP